MSKGTVDLGRSGIKGNDKIEPLSFAEVFEPMIKQVREEALQISKNQKSFELLSSELRIASYNGDGKNDPATTPAGPTTPAEPTTPVGVVEGAWVSRTQAGGVGSASVTPGTGSRGRSYSR